jgi:hypothetical protein
MTDPILPATATTAQLFAFAWAVADMRPDVTMFEVCQQAFAAGVAAGRAEETR